MRFVGYSRHSTDKQNPTSAEDQLYDIKVAGEAKGWVFVRGYADSAVCQVNRRPPSHENENVSQKLERVNVVNNDNLVQAR
ncbi:recombinase family protein [Parasedimentitalea psychrophila]|uniref:recombinase family protein n=1 Tax=Parasedimentitalea psychrophila TaxID=2997337 RepID=UPI0036F2C729